MINDSPNVSLFFSGCPVIYGTKHGKIQSIHNIPHMYACIFFIILKVVLDVLLLVYNSNCLNSPFVLSGQQMDSSE